MMANRFYLIMMAKLQLEKITYSYIYPYHIKVDMYSVKVESHS
jgi:hypothetical protein